MNMDIDEAQSIALVESVASRDVVVELLARSFTSRSIGEQKLIARMPRPTPKLAIKAKSRNFQESWYSKRD